MFLRRALAVDQGGLMSFGSHEKLHSRLLKAHLETPPPGYARVGIKQLRLADEKAWDLLAELTRGGIKGTSEQGTVIDGHIDKVMFDPRFTMLLVPLPAPITIQVPTPGRVAPPTPPIKKKTKAQKRQERAQQDRDRGRGGGRGRGRGRDKKKYTLPVPEELRPDGISETDDGDAICFAYNCRKGCPTHGARCGRGLHVCARKGCHEPHPMHACLDGEPLE